MKLDFKRLKKLHSDESCTVFQHEDGHEIKIAHSGLSKKMKTQLDEIPGYFSGGFIEDKNRIKEANEEAKRKVEASKPKTPKGPSRKAISYDDAMYNLTHKDDPGFVPRGYYEGDLVTQNADEEAGGFPPLSPESVQAMQKLSNPTNQITELPSISQDLEQTDASSPTIAVPQQAQAAPQMPQTNNQIEGIKQEAAALGAEGRAEVGAANRFQKQMEDLQIDHQNQTLQVASDLEAAVKDYGDGHIDPNHFWKDKGIVGKASTMIGLILGGISAGVTGGPNPAMAMLNKLIDNDIEAQKADLGKKQNVIAALQHQYNNIMDATNAAKAMKLEVFKAELQKAASSSKDPLARARALQAQGAIEQQQLALVQPIAMRQTLLNQTAKGNISPEQAVTMLPKEDQVRANEAMLKYNEGRAAMAQTDKLLDEMANEQTWERTLGSPLQSREVYKSKMVGLVSALKPVFGNITSTDMETIERAAIKFNDDADTIDKKKAMLRDLTAAKIQAYEQQLKGLGIAIPKPTGFTPLKK